MPEQGPPRWRENGAAAKAIFTPVAHRSTSDHHVMKMRCYQGYFHASAWKDVLGSFGRRVAVGLVCVQAGRRTKRQELDRTKRHLHARRNLTPAAGLLPGPRQ